MTTQTSRARPGSDSSITASTGFPSLKLAWLDRLQPALLGAMVGLVLWSGPVNAATLNQAIAAYDQGDHANALDILKTWLLMGMPSQR